MKSEWLNDLKLYLITDRKLFHAQCSLYFALENALDAGVRCIQLREKDLTIRELFDMAVWMRELTNEYHAKLFINDRVDVALAVNADGIHLGQNSIPLHAVKKIAGNRLLIGMSTHTAEEALSAERDGADFITFGPVYETPSKLKYGRPVGIDSLRRVKAEIAIPVFAIGGIKRSKVEEVRGAGADGIALISGILAAKNIQETAEEYIRLMR